MSLEARFLLERSDRPRSRISLVPMIDIFMILLVFFMVTSTYLDLDTIPLVETETAQIGDESASPKQARPLFVRIGSDGLPIVQGRSLGMDAFGALVAELTSGKPDLEVLLLPSGAADVQSLVTTMEAATTAGASRLRLVRLAGAP